MPLLQDLPLITPIMPEDEIVLRDASSSVTGRISLQQLYTAVSNLPAVINPTQQLKFVNDTTSYTVVNEDVGYIIKLTSSSAITVTLPPLSVPLGSKIYFRQGGTGEVTLVGGTSSGYTSNIEVASGVLAKTRAQGSMISIYLEREVGTTLYWVVVGDTKSA